MQKNTFQVKLKLVLLFMFSLFFTSFNSSELYINSEDFIEFYQAEQIPVFKGCDEMLTRKEAVECFNKKMTNHVKRNFTYPEEALENRIQGRVDVTFIISESGLIKDIKAIATNEKEYEKKILETEATRIVSLLPKFIPGKHQGKIVNIKYGLPITFKMM
ncbi:conserved hypothetical protein [Flavobacterium sp. 9AF]|uniref:energy transducer TonB n=1 Tax=Flavobacterium sp. 9AF TaxID=2653142 RepID=UPI0012F1A76E|nr:energy transducer TonB [Flavobacterium sp. 9AF]VXC35007.1 conserved hypothetical protein [Flavobacterium sp. 9AF]